MMAAAAICTGASTQAQVKNIYASASTLNLEVLQNQTRPIVLNRTLFAGYNSICLPMSLNAEQLQAAAKEVQVERLEAIRQVGDSLVMYFLDCTREGIKAGVPYLIFSPTMQTLHANTQHADGVSTALQCVTKSDGNGNTVTFGSSWENLKVAGRYGIPAQQDTYMLESVLIRTEGDKDFLPTRCGFTWDEQTTTAQALAIKHVVSMDDVETTIDEMQAAGTLVDVCNLQGAVVMPQTTISAAKQSLPEGIYVAKGQKFAVQ